MRFFLYLFDHVLTHIHIHLVSHQMRSPPTQPPVLKYQHHHSLKIQLTFITLTYASDPSEQAPTQLPWDSRRKDDKRDPSTWSQCPCREHSHTSYNTANSVAPLPAPQQPVAPQALYS